MKYTWSSKLTFVLGILSALLCSFAYAQTESVSAIPATIAGESIRLFDSHITVNTDNSIDVVETISYNTGQNDRHGIYRDIYPYSSEKRKINITDIEVTDQNGLPIRFETSKNGYYLRIKIGDPDTTFLGEKTYIIRYRAEKAVAQLEKVDEIYWNVTGNGWNIPISEVRATVVLPNNVKAVQSACYYGAYGSTVSCGSPEENGGGYTFVSQTMLPAGEGITVALGFEKGIVDPYTVADQRALFFQKYWMLALVIVLPILTFIFSMWYWYKRGRDPKGSGVIVPEYDVPDSLTPLEVKGIVYEKVPVTELSAEIIYLATRGYLRIREIEKKYLGFIKNTDYELIRLKDGSDLGNDFEKKLVQDLFAGGDTVKLSDLANVFYKKAAEVANAVPDVLLKKGYYKNLGRMKHRTVLVFPVLMIAFWLAFMLGGLTSAIFLDNNPAPMFISIIFSVIIFAVFYHFSPAKTEKGVRAKEHILGLREYLRIAEKDRLLFHNAPEKKPETFEKLLPFAMVLGVAKIWAKEFEDIYLTPPEWYSGTPGSHFSAIYFANSLSSFSTSASSSLTSSPGGSGGGGSSGGGGGGGGGGGW